MATIQFNPSDEDSRSVLNDFGFHPQDIQSGVITEELALERGADFEVLSFFAATKKSPDSFSDVEADHLRLVLDSVTDSKRRSVLTRLDGCADGQTALVILGNDSGIPLSGALATTGELPAACAFEDLQALGFFEQDLRGTYFADDTVPEMIAEAGQSVLRVTTRRKGLLTEAEESGLPLLMRPPLLFELGLPQPLIDQKYQGSAIVANGSGGILTAVHVVRDEGGRFYDEVKVFVGDREYRVQESDILWESAEARLIMLDVPYLELNPTVRPARFAKDLPAQGDPLVSVGYPSVDLLYALSKSDDFRKIDFSPRIYTFGTATGSTLLFGAHRFVKSDLELAHGQSGGPLFNQAGEVVGVNEATIAGVVSVFPSLHPSATRHAELAQHLKALTTSECPNPKDAFGVYSD